MDMMDVFGLEGLVLGLLYKYVRSRVLHIYFIPYSLHRLDQEVYAPLGRQSLQKSRFSILEQPSSNCYILDSSLSEVISKCSRGELKGKSSVNILSRLMCK